MLNKHNQICTSTLLLASLLVACGGGSSSNESEETEECEQVDTNNDPSDDCMVQSVTGITNSPGTGVCINFASPKVGDTSLIKNVTTVDGNSLETDVRTTYTAVSNTSWSYDSEGISGLGNIGNLLSEDLLPDGVELVDVLGQSSQTTETFTIANNFINITKSETTLPLTTTYSPSRRAPINEVCEGQIYTQNYTETRVSLGETITEQVNVKNTVEAVNVQKSAPAGTFNTFRVKSEGAGIDLTTWVDTASSAIVIMEARNVDGDLIGTSSLIEQ